MTAPNPMPPSMSKLDDVPSLMDEVGYYEKLPELRVDEFDRYVRAESALEDMILAEATRQQKEFGYAAADELFGRFLRLNDTQREICDREHQRLDGEPDYVRRLVSIRDVAAGNVILAEGLQFTCRAEERRLANDFDGAESNLNAAMSCFAQLADSDLPLQPVGALRHTLAAATSQMMAGLAHMGNGDFKGAYQAFDNTHVAFDELLNQADDGGAPENGPARAQYEELRRDLGDGIRYIQAVQSFVETLREAQNGNYGDAVLSGQEAAEHYERILNEAVARQVPRNARSLYEMELARVNGWVSWASAELAVDECRWADCRDMIRRARNQWNLAAHVAARNVFNGIISQRPATGDTDMLLQNTLRRCERELTFRKEIDVLNVKLDNANKIVMQIQANGGNAVAPGDNIFNAPVSAGFIGNQNRVDNVTANQTTNTGADLKELAGQLGELRELLAAAARTASERDSVAAVEAAQDAAKRGDESAVRRHLAAAGRWSLGVGEQIGLAVATTAIKAALGG
ncbi:hypothetical protein [Actinoplanes sp. NPDC051411]|uniref:hypothetical protein n=1 Tax=Actinoplanes sp. NPDC051411 TaxID=3155522 RepID=UPI00341B416F